MDALRIFTRAENGQLLVAIPKEMQGKPLEVVVKQTDNANDISAGVVDWEAHLKMVKERGLSMQKLWGAAPFADFKMDEDELYSQ